MAHRKLSSAVALTAAGLLTLTACGGGDDGGGEGGGGTASGEGGTVSIYNCEPQNLAPGNSSEVCGSKILEQLFTGLTTVDYETNEPAPGVAESWESEDSKTWTFTLGEDWTFHNGDPITAQTFADTWNWVVDPDNAQGGAGFFDKIKGYDAVIDGEADELEGVRVVDDYTLEVELTEPFSPFPTMASYTAFYPMPDVAFEDMQAFESSPIGNGRYQMDGEWVHDVEVNMTRYEDWAGEEPGKPERIEWKIYSDVETAYMDVQAGSLDLLDQAPPSRLSTLDSDFPDRSKSSETSSFTYMGFPMYQEAFKDPKIRHAISKAIDREEVVDAIFEGRNTPARNIIPPMLPQGREDACGENCEFDPEAAKQMYEEAGGPKELTFWFNSGAGHEEWVEAVANQLQNNLGLDSVQFESMEFAQYLDLQDEEGITGPYRLGWVLSYPSPQYAMEPIYTTGADSNYFGYSNEEFDAKIDEANKAEEGEEADGLYQEAEDILLEDMPAIPLWFQNFNTVYSDRIDGESVTVDPRTFLRVEQVVVND